MMLKTHIFDLHEFMIDCSGDSKEYRVIWKNTVSGSLGKTNYVFTKEKAILVVEKANQTRHPIIFSIQRNPKYK